MDIMDKSKSWHAQTLQLLKICCFQKKGLKWLIIPIVSLMVSIIAAVSMPKIVESIMSQVRFVTFDLIIFSMKPVRVRQNKSYCVSEAV